MKKDNIMAHNPVLMLITANLEIVEAKLEAFDETTR